MKKEETMELSMEQRTRAIEGEITPKPFLVLKTNELGYWVVGPECDLKPDSSDALLNAWLQKLHGLEAEQIDRKAIPVVIWAKKGRMR
jgi:hypothetical protein